MKKFNQEKKKILVGLSGGVDSFMTAFLLLRGGWQVQGVYLKMQNRKSQLVEARRLVKKLGIGLKVVDCQKQFQEKILKAFVSDYQAGETPNPCVFCNPWIKFRFLLDQAEKDGAAYVATGHYARVKLKRINGRKIFSLKKGRDEKKDQSYFLYRLNQRQLKKIILPLGEKKKVAVKKEAEKAGFYADNPQTESQDVCFFSSGQTLGDFLKKRIPSQPGKIIDEKGRFLGFHQGLEGYTLGQRQGIKLSGGPFFVVGKDFPQNQLVVSADKNNPLLWKQEFFLEKTTWVADPPEEKQRYLVKIRYGRNETPGQVGYDKKKKRWKVILEEKQWAPATGQSAVIYQKDQVIGGGIICQK